MKAFVIGDIHLADKPPSLRTETYTEDVLDKVRWCSLQAASTGCDFVLQLGDVFHIKSPYRTSHALVQAAHDALTAGGLEVVIVAGNHDMQHDRLESIPSQPLGSLARMEGVTLLEGWHPEFPVYGIPYLADWGDLDKWLPPFVDGYDEHSDVQVNTLKEAFQSTLRVPLVATHAPLFPPGQEPPYDYLEPYFWALGQKRGAVAYGHIHDPHGTYEEGGVLFANFGAISRGSLHAETLKRKPQASVYDFELGEFIAVPIPHRPVEEVFRLDIHEATQEKKAQMAAFLEELGSDILVATTIEKVLHDLDSMGLPPKTLAAARELVEEAYAKS